jgi:hypothetical protein
VRRSGRRAGQTHIEGAKASAVCHHTHAASTAETEAFRLTFYPATIVHGLADARAALAQGLPVTLLSAPGAALYAGCGWWKALVAQARAAYPGVPCLDILDCADGTGQAFAALRIGVCRLVLWPDAPARAAVVAIAEAQGGFVLEAAP